ncbi:MAG: OsmC family protein, partial [Ktedonobacterales bacterium]
QMVAESMGIATERIQVTVEGDLDLRGTLGIDATVPVGFTAIRAHFDIVAPTATPEQLASLREKAERYCVVMSTLRSAPAIETTWAEVG